MADNPDAADDIDKVIDPIKPQQGGDEEEDQDCPEEDWHKTA